MDKKLVAVFATLALALGLGLGLVIAPDDDAPKSVNGGGHPLGADLRYVCDHVTETFRSRHVGNDEQAGIMADELQGMVAVGNREVRIALTPVIETNRAIQAAGRDHAPERLNLARNKATFSFAQTCKDQGTDVRGMLGEN